MAVAALGAYSVATMKPRVTSRVSRRTFLRGAGALAAVPLFARSRWCGSPNATLDVACVGVGGMGRSDLASVASGRHVRITALCDVDRDHLEGAAKLHPEARTFRDFRRMLDELDDGIDAVVVSTPDHMHAKVALAAIERRKHVYCQKPLAHDLRECHLMQEAATRHRVVTQMGTQIHAHEAYRTAVATVRGGAIGRVREAHLWVGRSWAGPAAGRPDRTDPVPEQLDWDLWLGVAPERPFVAGLYHPANWRGWTDFGTGTLGDMGCHLFDPVFAALGLGPPRSVVSRGPQHGAETAGTTDSLTFRWTDGSVPPARERAGLPDGAQLPGSGSFLVGDRGVLVLPHWSMPKLYRDGAEVEGELDQQQGRDHYHEWTDACRGEGETSTSFAYSGPLTDAVLVGTVAGRFPDRRLAWDSGALRFDHDEATAFVRRSYRDGWAIDGV
jgi:predicted dehydrogenase